MDKKQRLSKYLYPKKPPLPRKIPGCAPGCFHVNIAKFLKIPILKNICKRLLLLCVNLDEHGLKNNA